MKKDNYIAIVLAAGQGSRMRSDVAKQYMTIYDKPMLYYSLKVFQESDIDEIVLVVGDQEADYCREHIVEYYGFDKVKAIAIGGKERYLSVYNALLVAEERRSKGVYDGEHQYVLIHDSARPLITSKIIEDTMQEVVTYNAVVVAVPSKDTIKIADETGIIKNTPKRSQTYIIQTPQAFEFNLLKQSYQETMKHTDLEITDDAMIVEHGSHHSIKIVEGDYKNIKVTTPEDIAIAEMLMKVSCVIA
ncbi:2-C-methyl-D-erythritol 4-phosphate cytidylyltransferase [Anaerosporobacter sp.]|uniref:2-C-methyl-D-erythritol 4-phosphate cytidylyltransferase n=1 Tax=Anaerosporobacter sp. TaxID=1872529 RepID=UPI00286F8E36|nr:2-C-methyl-D-erythritol 4-phosphate cytidylyltransferase [Anaerosporobacter sp.]